MKISGGLEDGGIVVGNTYDKYNSPNPLVQRIMAGFHRALDELVEDAGGDSIHEVGCGEGYWVCRWARQGRRARGSDFSSTVIDLARQNAAREGLADDLFSVASVYELRAPRDAADLVVCCEVLEHLEDPRLALEALSRVVTGRLIVSVPREPLWSVLNMARGRYWSRLGNTPGHLQRWSTSAFRGLVGDYFTIERQLTPPPWTMLLCGAKQGR